MSFPLIFRTYRTVVSVLEPAVLGRWSPLAVAEISAQVTSAMRTALGDASHDPDTPFVLSKRLRLDGEVASRSVMMRTTRGMH